MKATSAYAAKRALIDRLAVLAATLGNPLYGVQVDDSYPRDLADRAIYGGGARFLQSEEAAEAVIRFETITAGLYVRILAADTVRAVESSVEALGDEVAAALAADPELAGGLTFMQIVAGSCDFYPTDAGVEAILSLSVQIESHLS